MPSWEPFIIVHLDGGVLLQLAAPPFESPPQRYVYLVDDARFYCTCAVITERGLEHWTDPRRTKPKDQP